MSYELWKNLWVANYTGKTDAAKELSESTKKNYKGHLYVPWATMVKWLFLFDENAQLNVLQNEKGGLVFSDTGFLENSIAEENIKHDGKDDKDVRISKTNSSHHKSNFVIVECIFMGKKYVETYPIQDNAYNSPAYFDSNMVNKSIQRAKAKVISTATGLAFSLYENGDLQFEDDSVHVKEEKKPVSLEAPKELPSKKVDDTKNNDEDKTVKSTSDVELAAKFIKDHDDDIMNEVLQTYNVEFIKNYKFSLSKDEDIDSIMSKLSNLPRPELFYKTLVKRYDSKVSK